MKLKNARKRSKKSNVLENIPMVITVLGPGCMNCKTLERRTQEAVDQMKIAALVQKITDLDSIAAHGVMRTPGLVIDGKVVWQGGVPTVEKIKELITANMQVGQ